MKKAIATAIGSVAVSLLVALPASAAGSGAETDTYRYGKVRDEFSGVVPCLVPVTTANITTVSSGVVHVTGKDGGTFHHTGTVTGSYKAVTPTTTYEGNYTIRFGVNSNNQPQPGMFSYSITARSDDGSTNLNAHYVDRFEPTSSDPQPTRKVFHSHCGAGTGQATV